MKRILCLLLCAVMLCGMLGVSASAEGTVTLVVTGGTAAPGETVEVLVSIENNPSISGVSGEIKWDESVMTYEGFTAKTNKGVWSMDTFADDHMILWYYDGLTDAYTGTELIALQFKVAEDAAPGEYPVSIVLDPEWDAIVDEDNNTIEDFETVAGTVTITGEEPEVLENGYYLIGQKGWTVDDIDPEQKFETNPKNTNEFLLETGLAEGDGIKVVKVENGAIAAWYPDGMDNQYVVDAAHAGLKTIYFHPWRDDAWSAFGGYIWIDAALTIRAEVYGSSVSLKGDIALNFYLILPEELTEDTGAYVMLNETKCLVSKATTRTIENIGTVYQFTIALHAKQMNDKVTLKVFTGEDAVVPLYRHSNGENETETGYQYSVQDYIQNTLEKSSDENLKALVQAMSDYGSLAQVQFNYNTGDAKPVQGDLDSVTAETVKAYEKKLTEGTTTGVSFSGGTLVLESTTTIKLYFMLEEGEIGDYTFKVGKKVKTPTETAVGEETLWAIEIPNISAKDLDKTYTVKVTREDDTVLTLKYSGLSYAYSVLSGNSSEESLVRLVKGLVLYNQAADAYFAA